MFPIYGPKGTALQKKPKGKVGSHYCCSPLNSRKHVFLPINHAFSQKLFPNIKSNHCLPAGSTDSCLQPKVILLLTNLSQSSTIPSQQSWQ
ncbi:unnamed protein product [Prunus brigantina]